jgi:hypothetical protein
MLQALLQLDCNGKQSGLNLGWYETLIMHPSA